MKKAFAFLVLSFSLMVTMAVKANPMHLAREGTELGIFKDAVVTNYQVLEVNNFESIAVIATNFTYTNLSTGKLEFNTQFNNYFTIAKLPDRIRLNKGLGILANNKIVFTNSYNHIYKTMHYSWLSYRLNKIPPHCRNFECNWVLKS